MTRPFIVLGDISSHGGSVQTASAGFTVNGIAVVVQGDTFNCPLHGSVTIQAVGYGMRANDKTPARDGDKASCGARLIASQKSINWKN